jgi:hypothetical protein
MSKFDFKKQWNEKIKKEKTKSDQTIKKKQEELEKRKTYGRVCARI